MSSATGAADQAALGVRGEILEAMLAVAAESGFAGVKLEDLAERAGLSMGAVNEHFTTESACFMAAFDLVVERVGARIAEHVTPGEWPDQVRSAVGAVVELFAAEPGLARVALVEVAAVGPEAMLRYRDALERLHAPLERGRAYAERGADLPEGVAAMALGAGITLLVDEVRERRRDPERLEHELLFALLLPYLGPEAADAELSG